MRNQRNRAHVIAIGNQKGGVAKTTNCVHIAAALGELGRKCLIVDLDGNAGSTRHFGIPEEANFLGTFEVLTGVETAEDVIITGEDADDSVTLPKGVHLLPARRNLERIETALREKDKFIAPRDVFGSLIESVASKYDYVFLDTAPNAGILTIATYLTAEWFILAAIPEHLAIDGLKAALDDIRNAQKRGNAEVALLGVVLSCVNKRYRTAQLLSKVVQDTFMPAEGEHSLKFDTEISRSVVIPQASGRGVTIFEYEPDHAVAEQYRSLAREVEQRLAERNAAQETAEEPSEAVVANG